MACIGSLQLEDNPTPAGATKNEVREEGIAFHYMIEKIFANEFSSDELVDRKSPNGVLMTDFMAECADEYLDTLKSEPGTLDIEVDCINAGDGYQVNGRADARQTDLVNDVLTITDAKFGWSVVEPERNWTLISHAVSTSKQNGWLPKRVVLRIYQPRSQGHDGPWRTWEITGSELYDLNLEIEQRLQNPTSDLRSGPQCDYCPKKVGCDANLKAMFNAIDVSSVAFQDTLTVDQLSAQMTTMNAAMKRLKKRVDAYEEHMIYRLQQGEVIPGYGFERKAGREYIPSEITPEIMQQMAPGKDVVKKTVRTPKQMLAAGVDPAIVNSLKKSTKKTVLVAMSATERAKKSFG